MLVEKYKPEVLFYRIKEGDSKNRIADKFNTEIKNVKCLTEDCEETGDFYIISNIKSNSHVVKPMESLRSIAEKYKISEEEIIRQNNLKTKQLFIGQKLRF